VGERTRERVCGCVAVGVRERERVHVCSRIHTCAHMRVCVLCACACAREWVCGFV